MKNTSLTALILLLGLPACDSATPNPAAPEVPELAGKRLVAPLSAMGTPAATARAEAIAADHPDPGPPG